MEFAIVVARRSWFEISLWKIGKGRKKEKGAKEKSKRDGIQTAELNRRDQVTATNSWPSFLRKGGQRSITRWQHLLNRVHPTCTERPSLNKECGWKGGDRSGLAQGQELTGRKRRTKTSLQERKKNILDTHRPSHGRSYPAGISSNGTSRAFGWGPGDLAIASPRAVVWRSCLPPLT